MEGEGWILRLPSDAPEVHAGALSAAQDLSTKRTHEDCVMDPNPEDEGGAKDLRGEESSKRRRISPNTGVLRGRPILRDVFNDIIDLT
jgi:DNA replication ATP-dependent helicase Dna2